jgi:hypothetical protein
MPATQISDTIPTDTAWKTGRRIYIRCGYQSQLNTDLRDVGAKWDPTERALWVGSGKLTTVVPLVEAHLARKTAIVAVKTAASAANRWVSIPFDATHVRDRAKALGAKWDGTLKRWALPTDEALAEIQGMLATYAAAVEAQKAARRAAEAQARAAAATQDKAATVATQHAAVARAGRTLTGETGRFGEHSTARHNRASAEHAARPVGSIVRLAKGRAIITGVKVWFTGEDLASSTCWHADTHDEAHWDWSYEVAYVEPTDAETAADEATAANRADEAELGAVFAEMQHADRTDAGEQDGWSAVTGPTIQRWGGSITPFDDGRIILAGDRVVLQHPGYYDDYRRSERASTDPALTTRVRDLIQRGPRKVGPYTVTN